jgi:hypothetical protein
MQAIASHFKWVKDIGDIKIQIFIDNQWELHGVLKDILFILIFKRNLFLMLVATIKDIETLHTKIRCKML